MPENQYETVMHNIGLYLRASLLLGDLSMPNSWSVGPNFQSELKSEFDKSGKVLAEIAEDYRGHEIADGLDQILEAGKDLSGRPLLSKAGALAIESFIEGGAGIGFDLGRTPEGGLTAGQTQTEAPF